MLRASQGYCSCLGGSVLCLCLRRPCLVQERTEQSDELAQNKKRKLERILTKERNLRGKLRVMLLVV